MRVELLQKVGLFVVLRVGRGLKFEVPATMGALRGKRGTRMTAIGAFSQILKPVCYASPEFDSRGRVEAIKDNRNPTSVFPDCFPTVLKRPIAGQIVFQKKGVAHPDRGELALDESPFRLRSVIRALGPETLPFRFSDRSNLARAKKRIL
jgi:hypothetical protein